jgi:peptidoglycan/LPS O-acetylase OafA/YrhL
MTPTRRIVTILIGLALIAICGIFGSGDGPRAILTYPIVTVSAVLLLLGMLGANLSSLPRFLMQPLVYLGRISYGLYVFHGVTIGLVSAGMTHYVRIEQHSLQSFVLRISLSMLLTIGAATLSYRFLEHPFLLLKAKREHIATGH